MSLKTDCEGIALTADIKLSNYATTWNTRLKDLGRTDCRIIIVTFSLADVNYIHSVLSRRKNGDNITLICNTSYYPNAQALKNLLPGMRVFVSTKAHAKLVLAEPDIVWVSSENIGHMPKSFDATIEIQNQDVYDHYKRQVDNLLRCRSTIMLEEDEYYA